MVTVVFKEPRSDSPLEEFEVFGHVREPDDGYVTAVQKFHRSKRADAERYALTLMQRLQADDFERC